MLAKNFSHVEQNLKSDLQATSAEGSLSRSSPRRAQPGHLPINRYRKS